MTSLNIGKNSPFVGQHVLFVGGCGGIGKVVSALLLQQGANLSATSLPGSPNLTEAAQIFQNTIEESKSSSQYQIWEADITNEEQINKMLQSSVAKFGKIDHLVIAAGVSHLGKLLDVTRQEWDLIIDTNVWGVLSTIQKTLPHLNKNAKIIVFGSDVGLGKPSHDIPLYSISKTALHSIITLLAQELPAQGFSICGVAPYNTPPGMRNVYHKEDGKIICEAEDCNTPDWGNLPPTGRFIDSRTIAQTISFILQTSSDLNGTIIPITGGYGMTVS